MYSNKVTFISVALYTIQTNSKCVWVCAAVCVCLFGYLVRSQYVHICDNNITGWYIKNKVWLAFCLVFSTINENFADLQTDLMK